MIRPLFQIAGLVPAILFWGGQPAFLNYFYSNDWDRTLPVLAQSGH